jgi:hypothetical protein
MSVYALRVALLILLSLLVGTMFGVLVGADPASLSAGARRRRRPAGS